MSKRLSKEIGMRMWGGSGSSSGSGGGGGFDPSMLAGYATQSWVNDGFVSKPFLNEMFIFHGKQTVTVKRGDEVISTTTTDIVLSPNELPSTVESYDEGTGLTTITERKVDSIEAKVGFWTGKYVSSLGQNSGGGGGGGGSSTLAGLNDVQFTPDPLTPAQAGQILQYDGNGHWVNASLSATGVTSVKMTVPTGFTVSNASEQTIISTGTFALAFGGTITKNYVLAAPSNVNGTPSWRALVASDIPNLSAGKITSGTFDAARIPDLSGTYATRTWVGQQGFLTSVAFGDLTSHPTTLNGYGITDAYTKTEANAKFMTIAAFENLFAPLNSSGNAVSHPYSSGVASIKALFGLWTEQYLSALGQGSGGGGGGGVSLNEPLASINNSFNDNLPSAADKVIVYSGSSSWVYQDWHSHGNKTALDSITAAKIQSWDTGAGVATGLAGGTVAAGKADKLTTARNLWGQSFDGTANVTGSLTSVINITMSGNINMNNAKSINIKDANNTSLGILTVDSSSNLIIGETVDVNQYNTYIRGRNVIFQNVPADGAAGDRRRLMQLDNGGRLQLFMGDKGLRIGDGLITWDSTNNAIKIQRFSGSSIVDGNIYATGSVTALGANSGGGSDFDILTANKVNLGSGNKFIAKGYISGTEILTLYSDTSIFINAANGVAVDGNLSSYSGTWFIGTIGSAQNCARFSRLYLDNSRYIFLDGSTLKYYNGSTSKTIVVQ